MHNHVGDEYRCPICIAIQGIENEQTWIKQDDFVYRDELVSVFISSKFFKGNEGHPLVVPAAHIENIYDLSDEVARRIVDVSRKVAIALKEARGCDGVTIIQNNEPAGDQHAFHYHAHIIPRFEGDGFHQELFNTYLSDPQERVEYAQKLREALKV